METTIVTKLPAARLTEARDMLAKLHTRLTKAAARTGQAAPAAPELIVVAEYATVTCAECGAIGGVAGLACPVPSCEGTLWTRNYVDVAVQVDRPCLAGWEFLAVVEPLDGGNLIRQVPGANTDGVSFEAWRSGAVKCTHCNTIRRRTETFLVRGADCEIKQVGRQCLADFLGGQSPAAIIASLGYLKAVRDMAGEGGGSGRDNTFDPFAYLSQTVAVIRLAGWISKGAAGDRQPTAATVSYLLTPQFGFQGREEWRKARIEFAVTDADVERATEVLAWARDLPGSTDYEQNLRLVAQQLRTEPRHTGILASAVSAYERALGNDLRKRAESLPSTHQGEVGKRVTLELTVEKVADFDTQYGSMHLHMMRDAAGNMFVWKTGSHRIEPGKKVAGKCTVKEHSEFRGTPQTVLTRCALEVK